MFLFAEMPILIVPTAVLSIVTVGRVYTIIAERWIDRSNDSDFSNPRHDSDANQQHVRHA